MLQMSSLLVRDCTIPQESIWSGLEFFIGLLRALGVSTPKSEEKVSVSDFFFSLNF